MRRSHLALAGVSLSLLSHQSGGNPRGPHTPDEVARPGRRLPGSPKIALVKLADGICEPTRRMPATAPVASSSRSALPGDQDYAVAEAGAQAF